jgi:hypothetical protein
MTPPLKKVRERLITEEAAKLMGKTWDLGPDREHPDFLITEGTQRFGLEVSEIFMGSQSRAGSVMKKRESDTQRVVNALRHEYETVANIPLTVKFVGDMCATNMATVVPALVAADLPSKPIGHHFIHDTSRGLRVHITKGFRSEWYSVNDRVGWVDRNPAQIIAAAIGKKSKELPRYTAAVGADICLLLVANRIYNSGKLALEEPIVLDLNGFKAVYFYARPETVSILKDAGTSSGSDLLDTAALLACPVLGRLLDDC